MKRQLLQRMEQQNEEHYTQIAELQAFILQQIQLTHMVANDLWDQLQQQRLQLASQQTVWNLCYLRHRRCQRHDGQRLRRLETDFSTVISAIRC